MAKASSVRAIACVLPLFTLGCENTESQELQVGTKMVGNGVHLCAMNIGSKPISINSIHINDREKETCLFEAIERDKMIGYVGFVQGFLSEAQMTQLQDENIIINRRPYELQMGDEACVAVINECGENMIKVSIETDGGVYSFGQSAQ